MRTSFLSTVVVPMVLALAIMLPATDFAVAQSGSGLSKSRSLTGEKAKPQSGLVFASDPDGMVSILRDLGYRPSLSKDSHGDPLIEFEVSNIKTSILFYACTENRDCQLIQFRSTFTRARDATTASMANWNRGRVIGVGYLDSDSDAVLEMPVNLHGGVTRANFDDTVEWWDVVLKQFKEHIGG